jgi:hypothetical protein
VAGPSDSNPTLTNKVVSYHCSNCNTTPLLYKKEKREKDYFKDAFVDALLLLLLFSKTMCVSESKTSMGSQKWDQRYRMGSKIPKGSDTQGFLGSGCVYRVRATTKDIPSPFYFR